MCFQIDWASLVVGSKFTVFALFYFVFEDNFPSRSPTRGLIFGGAYFRNFTVSSCHRAISSIYPLVNRIKNITLNAKAGT